jgi:hypothetical protein
MTGLSFCSASLYLIESLYEAFAGSSRPENESSPNRVLIKKKRAVHRGRFTLFPQSGCVVVFTAADLTSRRFIHIEKKQAHIVRSRLKETSGFLPLFSGLSPPYLS